MQLMEAFKAPIANFENDGLNDFSINDNHLSRDDISRKIHNLLQPLDDDICTSLNASLENLVLSFDATVSKCFNNMDEKTDTIAPVQSPTEDEILKRNGAWYTITCNFGNLAPLDWSKSHIRDLQLKVLNVQNAENVFSLPVHDNDYEVDEEEAELCEAFDYHNMVTSQLVPDDSGFVPHLYDDNEDVECSDYAMFKSADEVIDEIDEIMMGNDINDDYRCSVMNVFNCFSPTPLLSSARLELMQFRDTYHPSSPHWTTALNKLSKYGLSEYVEDLEQSIKQLSGILVEELAIRDEQEFEKEQRDQFVSLLITIQKRKRELQKQQAEHYKQQLLEGLATPSKVRKANKKCGKEIDHDIANNNNNNNNYIYTNNNKNTIGAINKKSSPRLSNLFSRKFSLQRCLTGKLSAGSAVIPPSAATSVTLNADSISDTGDYIYDDAPDGLNHSDHAVMSGSDSNGSRIMIDHDLDDIGHNSFSTGDLHLAAAQHKGLANPIDVKMLTLSTVIPYHRSKAGNMFIPEMQVLNKILRAILNDSTQLNSLLTEYILNVYAPSEETTFHLLN